MGSLWEDFLLSLYSFVVVVVNLRWDLRWLKSGKRKKNIQFFFFFFYICVYKYKSNNIEEEEATIAIKIEKEVGLQELLNIYKIL